MKVADITQYKPQRMFLAQGNMHEYEMLLQELQSTYPFVHSLFVPRLTMDHGKSIVAFMAERTGEERVFVIYFSVFSPDAAQALLKTLEEPDPDVTLIFMTPYPYIVPPTIRSRVMIVPTEHTATNKKKLTKVEAEAFIKKELATDGDDDAATRRAKAVAFLDDLEAQYRGSPESVRGVYEAKHMLFHANIPSKYVVEYAVSIAMQ